MISFKQFCAEEDVGDEKLTAKTVGKKINKSDKLSKKLSNNPNNNISQPAISDLNSSY